MTYYISYVFSRRGCSCGFGYVVSKIEGEMSPTKLNDILESVFNPDYMDSVPVAISWQLVDVESLPYEK